MDNLDIPCPASCETVTSKVRRANGEPHRSSSKLHLCAATSNDDESLKIGVKSTKLQQVDLSGSEFLFVGNGGLVPSTRSLPANDMQAEVNNTSDRVNVTQPGACDTTGTCKGTKLTPSTWIPAHEPRILSVDLKEYCVLLEGHLADVGAGVHPHIVLPKRAQDRKSMTKECTNLSCGELNPQTSSLRDC